MNKRELFLLSAAAGAVATNLIQRAAAQPAAVAGAIRASDYPSLQDALNHAESRGGGTVHFDRSETISTTVFVPSYVTLIGDGTSKLTADPALGFSAGRVMLSSKDYGLGNAAIGVRIENMIVDGNNSGAAPVSRLLGIVMNRTHDFKVVRNRVANCTGYGIWALGDSSQVTKYGVIADNHVENCQVGIETLDTESVSIRDNVVICTVGRALSGIHPWRSERIAIEGNVVDVDGSGFSGSGIDITTCSHIQLGHNSVSITGNSGGSGIALLAQSDFGGHCSHITCNGGYYYSEGGPAVLIVDNQAGSDFENIAINGAHLDGWLVGIQLQPAARTFRGIRVRDCYILSRGDASGAQSCFGIWWRAPIENLSVEGCSIVARSGAGRQLPLLGYVLQRVRNNRFSPDPGPIVSQVYHEGYPQQIPDRSYTPLSWNAARFNALSGYNRMQPARLTVPGEIRRVRLTGQVAFDSNGVGARGARIARNGAPLTVAGGTLVASAGTSVHTVISVMSAVLNVTPGTYFELQVYQSSGAPLDVSPENTWFSMEPAD